MHFAFSFLFYCLNQFNVTFLFITDHVDAKRWDWKLGWLVQGAYFWEDFGKMYSWADEFKIPSYKLLFKLVRSFRFEQDKLICTSSLILQTALKTHIKWSHKSNKIKAINIYWNVSFKMTLFMKRILYFISCIKNQGSLLLLCTLFFSSLTQINF